MSWEAHDASVRAVRTHIDQLVEVGAFLRSEMPILAGEVKTAVGGSQSTAAGEVFRYRAVTEEHIKDMIGSLNAMAAALDLYKVGY
jgi:hypothetical protein